MLMLASSPDFRISVAVSKKWTPAAKNRIELTEVIAPIFIQRGRAPDPVAFLHANEQRARERQVAIETVKLLRQRVIECVRKEGVNHYENCRHEASDYYNTVTKKDMGQLHPEWANPEKKDGW